MMSSDVTADRLQVMTVPTEPDVVRAIRPSCQWLSEREAAFIDRVHDYGRGLLPGLRQLAPPDGRAVSEQLVALALWAAQAPDPPEVIEATLRKIGADNHREGFPDEQYVSFGHALLRALRDVYGGEWTTSLSSGWVGYYQWFSGQLLVGAAGREPEPSAAPPAADHVDRGDRGDPPSGPPTLVRPSDRSRLPRL